MESVWDAVSFFEKEVAAYCNAKYGIAVDSCSNAIFLTFKYLSTVESAKMPVQVPKRTYISVPMSIVHAGYEVEFVDKNWSGSYKLDPYNVVDSACEFKEGMHESDFTCLSFHFKKLISIGKGGMILTNDDKAADWLRKARYDGRDSYFYNDILNTDVDIMGYHMYMTPEQAIRGVEQFYRAKNDNKTICGESSEYKVDLSKLKVFQK
jgi:dTDP-4-amino-4,6-dideoxygalactose transaminase